MAITLHKRGYALIVAVVLTTVMLTFGLALGSLAYKQTVLASDAVRSQYAFYAADSALECALYADQQANLFDYTSHDGSNRPAPITTVVCDFGTPAVDIAYSYASGASGSLRVQQRLVVGSNLCADVVIIKAVDTADNVVYAQGYSTSCANVAAGNIGFVSRGLKALK